MVVFTFYKTGFFAKSQDANHLSFILSTPHSWTVPDPSEVSQSQLVNSPTEKIVKPGRIKNTNVSPEDLSNLERSMPLQTHTIGHQIHRPIVRMSPPPIRKPIVVKHKPISSPPKKAKSRFIS